MESKKKNNNKVVKTILTILFLILAGAVFVGYKEYTRESVEGNPISIEIHEGMSTKEVVSLLKEKGVIRFELPFYLKIYRSNQLGKLRYGIYELNDGMSLDEIIQTLADGGKENEDTIVLTIPEGYSIQMIADRLEKQEIMSSEEFLEAVKAKAADFVYASQLPPAEECFYQLEGFLFPDTYHLDKDTTAEELVDMCLKEFVDRIDESRVNRAKELNMTITELVTRASMIQKETDLPEEYPIIAGVINNRLAQNMRIQFDSTVVYAMTKGKYGVDRLLFSDLKLDSPYNTYQRKGIPVGPICNPGIEAIDAVLYPAEHNYLFFQIDTQKNDGSNLFFENYEEHLAASSTTEKIEETTGSGTEPVE